MPKKYFFPFCRLVWLFVFASDELTNWAITCCEALSTPEQSTIDGRLHRHRLDTSSLMRLGRTNANSAPNGKTLECEISLKIGKIDKIRGESRVSTWWSGGPITMR